MSFRRNMINEDSIKLSRKLNQLRTIVASILRNSRYYENLIELFKKHPTILVESAVNANWQGGAINQNATEIAIKLVLESNDQ